jgi:uncharacterized protein with PQ loop repeat
MIIAILAWSGAALSCLLTIPQAIRTLRIDRLDAISATTYWIVLGNAVIWAAWSVLTQQYAAGVPALVNGPAAVLILRRLHRANRPAATPPSEHLPTAEAASSPLPWTVSSLLAKTASRAATSLGARRRRTASVADASSRDPRYDPRFHASHTVT